MEKSHFYCFIHWCSSIVFLLLWTATFTASIQRFMNSSGPLRCVSGLGYTGRMLGFTQFIGAGLLLGSMILLTREKTNGEFTLQDHNHNLKYNLLHEFCWGFGVAFHTLYAIVPLFLRDWVHQKVLLFLRWIILNPDCAPHIIDCSIRAQYSKYQTSSDLSPWNYSCHFLHHGIHIYKFFIQHKSRQLGKSISSILCCMLFPLESLYPSGLIF
ncbi:MAG: hypothetical protein Ct9H300mP29_7010 [Candidatus Neomarinimicrobiota bacterium]|nr:MAG: hypothetical protein Ct9H300mP29_7010 [Candidatus Neomarinimicrobiota bacterium]